MHDDHLIECEGKLYLLTFISSLFVKEGKNILCEEKEIEERNTLQSLKYHVFDALQFNDISQAWSSFALYIKVSSIDRDKE